MTILLSGNALIALAAAFFWGGGDFSGGMGVKRAGGTTGAALRVVLLSHVMSFSVLLLLTQLRADPFPHGALLAWGVAAGVAGGLSLTAFYIALSRGSMGASAAVSGLLAASIPAAFGLVTDGSPGARQIVGFVVAGVAIWLIAAGPSDAGSSAGTMGLAVAAGTGFGLYFIALKMAGPAGVLWPMATARMGSLSVCSIFLLVLSLRGRSNVTAAPRVNRKVVLWSASTALLDTSGNLLFVEATRRGRLDVAAVLGSLYPASTILLAALMLGESPTLRQGLGMLTAVAAVLLIAV
jgi:drug/metabolite transporter (DMT)-like permease